MANSVINFPGALGTSPAVLLYQQHEVTNSLIAQAGNTGSFKCDSDNAFYCPFLNIDIVSKRKNVIVCQ